MFHCRIEAPCSPAEAGFPLRSNKLRGIRSLLQFKYIRVQMTKSILVKMNQDVNQGFFKKKETSWVTSRTKSFAP
jgi:hypothetical protein